MDIRRKSRNSLSVLFLKQLLILAAFILLEIIVFVYAFIIFLGAGIFLPSNYSEKYLVSNENAIKESEPFDESLIPHTARYGLYDKDYVYISGNLSSNGKQEAEDYLNGKKANGYFLKIDRENEYCIVQYDYRAHFSNKFLDENFVSPELCFIIIFLICFVAIIILNAVYFSRRLKEYMKPLKDEIELIKERNLDFEQRSSNVKEFDEILFSLYDMRLALSESLKKEWESEQKRKSNISALAHDIKTPLTIIKGSAELINEEENLNEIYELAKTIDGNSDKIEGYIKLLIDQTKNNVVLKQSETIDLDKFIEGIAAEGESLCRAQNINLIVNKSCESKEITVDFESIERSIMNVLKNAVEHTKEDRKIIMDFTYKSEALNVSVEDFGQGFKGKSVKHAKDEFYTENEDRGTHYGLGMYIADTVTKQYNGSLTYYNKEDDSGAVVVLKFKL